MSLENYMNALTNTSEAAKHFYEQGKTSLANFNTENFIPVERAPVQMEHLPNVGSLSAQPLFIYSVLSEKPITRYCAVITRTPQEIENAKWLEEKTLKEQEEKPEIAVIYSLKISQTDSIAISSIGDTIFFSIDSKEYCGNLLSVSSKKLLRYDKDMYNNATIPTSLTDIREDDKSILDILIREIESIPEIKKYAAIIVEKFKEILSLDPTREEKPLPKEALVDLAKNIKLADQGQTISKQELIINDQREKISRHEQTISDQAKEIRDQKQTILDQGSTIDSQESTILNQEQTISKCQVMLKTIFEFFDKHLNKGIIKLALGKEGKKDLESLRKGIEYKSSVDR